MLNRRRLAHQVVAGAVGVAGAAGEAAQPGQVQPVARHVAAHAQLRRASQKVNSGSSTSRAHACVARLPKPLTVGREFERAWDKMNAGCQKFSVARRSNPEDDRDPRSDCRGVLAHNLMPESQGVKARVVTMRVRAKVKGIAWRRSSMHLSGTPALTLTLTLIVNSWGSHQDRLPVIGAVREEELAAGDAEHERRDGLGGGTDHLLQAGARHWHRPEPLDERDLRQRRELLLFVWRPRLWLIIAAEILIGKDQHIEDRLRFATWGGNECADVLLQQRFRPRCLIRHLRAGCPSHDKFCLCYGIHAQTAVCVAKPWDSANPVPWLASESTAVTWAGPEKPSHPRCGAAMDM